MIREPQAHRFYPMERDELHSVIDKLLHKAPDVGPYSAGITPHAGYSFSGIAAAALYKNMSRSKTLIILGNDHCGNCRQPSLHPYEAWRTPLGDVPVDIELADKLDLPEAPSTGEHSIEVQLPFLQHLWDEFQFLPITVPRCSASTLRELGSTLSDLDVPLVATTDLSHYVPSSVAARLDRLVIEKILDRDSESLAHVVRDEGISMCGLPPVMTLLNSSPGEPELITYYDSSAITKQEPVVGYTSIGFK